MSCFSDGVKDVSDFFSGISLSSEAMEKAEGLSPVVTETIETVEAVEQSVTHVVRSGETLSTIAGKYENITYQDIAKANGISNPDNIYVGQRLNIPNQSSVPKPKVPATPAKTKPTIKQPSDETSMDGGKGSGCGKKEPDCNKKFHKISKIVLRHEGGYVNDPNDPGGATNKGIAWPTWKQYAKKDLGLEPTLTNLKLLSDKNAEIIYRKRYWEPKGFCLIKNDRVGLMVYDWTITSGGATKKIQQLLKNEFNQNITIDGGMGEKTIQAINNVKNQDRLLKRITAIRKQYYTNLAYKNGEKTKLYKFLKGWLNRVDDCLKVNL